MLNTDRSDFDHQINLLMAAFGQWQVTPIQRDAFWLGLNDCRLSEIVANVAKLCALARKGQPVPRPAELRNVLPAAEYRPADPKQDAAFAAAEAFAARTWHEFLASDPDLARLDLGIAQCGRILARDHQSTPQYAEAAREDRRLRDQRYDLWRERAKSNPSPVWK